MDKTMNTPFGKVDPETVRAAQEVAEDNHSVEEITIKFAKGLCSEPFKAKSGKDLVRILIPNSDPDDHSPWQEFVLPEKAVHENKFGKGLWAKIPADGHTTVSKPFLAGQDEEGKNVWKTDFREVPNRELKEMVEFYKTRNREERNSAPRDREAGNKVPKAEAEEKEEPSPETGRASVKKQLDAGKKERTSAKAGRKVKQEPER